MRLLLAAACFLSTIGMAEAHEYRVGEILIIHPWALPSLESPTEAAVYMTLINFGAAPERLVAASSPIAERTELHHGGPSDRDPTMPDIPIAPGEPSIMSAAIRVIPGLPTVLAPGGIHLMLIGLHWPLQETPTFTVSLTFEHAGTVDVLCIAALHSPDHGTLDH